MLIKLYSFQSFANPLLHRIDKVCYVFVMLIFKYNTNTKYPVICYLAKLVIKGSYHIKYWLLVLLLFFTKNCNFFPASLC